MNCIECGKDLSTGSVFNAPTCKGCAIKLTVKDFFFRLLIPLTIAFILYKYAGMVFEGNINQQIFTFMLVGAPFGVRRMFAWVIPGGGHTVAGSVMIILLNVIVGALIGWAMLGYYLIVTPIKTIYRLIRILTFKERTPVVGYEIE